MAGDTKQILDAVRCLSDVQVESTKQITKRMDTFDERQVEQGKNISDVREAHVKHRAWHNGVEKAESKAAQEGARDKKDDREKEKVFSTRLKLVLMAGALLVSIVVYIVSYVATASPEPRSDVRALTVSVNKLNQALDKMLDAPRTLSSRADTTSMGGGG